MLDAKNINSFYGEFQVLEDISMKVNEGEYVIVFGPNGHGKSTLLKVICGLVKIKSGSITFNGQEIHRLPSNKIVEMGIVYIAEDRHLFPEMTVLENLKLGAYNKNAWEKEEENFKFIFHLFPRLKGWSNRLAKTLSGGEARMLAIGRGIMSNANFLAIDEPSLGLAPNLRHDVFKAINEIRNKGISILLVEQNITKIIDYADKVYMIEDGHIVFEGNKNNVLNEKHVKEVFLGI